jgi:hypothetical protein
MASEVHPKLPFLERFGVQFFERRSATKSQAVSVDEVHIINEQEHRALRSVQRGCLFRAGLAGALSGGASAGAEWAASRLLPEGAALFSAQAFSYWAVLGGVTLAAAFCEILFLFWDTLRSVHELSRAAGLQLFSVDSDPELAQALARAALELPNRIDVNPVVNPLRDSHRLKLVFAAVAYKAKVGVTNFLIKLIVRRMAGRAALRGIIGALVPFVAVPVTASWNALVAYRLLEEARIRAMGPSAIAEKLERLKPQLESLSALGKQAAVRAVAAVIVKKEDLHPNLKSLLDQVLDVMGDNSQEPLDDVSQFLALLPMLPLLERKLCFTLLSLAAVVDGRLTSRERGLVAQVAQRAQVSNISGLKELRRQFVKGDGLGRVAVA